MALRVYDSWSSVAAAELGPATHAAMRALGVPAALVERMAQRPVAFVPVGGTLLFPPPSMLMRSSRPASSVGHHLAAPAPVRRSPPPPQASRGGW
jgi:hypothetical protein